MNEIKLHQLDTTIGLNLSILTYGPEASRTKKHQVAYLRWKTLALEHPGLVAIRYNTILYDSDTKSAR